MGRGVTVRFTGLPSAGKTTVANLTEKRLADTGRQAKVMVAAVSSYRAVGDKLRAEAEPSDASVDAALVVLERHGYLR